MASSYSCSFSTEELIGWLRAQGIDEDDCSKIKAAKFRGASFIRIEKEEHFKEIGIPLGPRLHLEELIKQAKSDVANSMSSPAMSAGAASASRRHTHHGMGLTANNLSRELESVVEWKKLAVGLNIPSNEIEKCARNFRQDVDGQKLSLFGYIERNHKLLGITWASVCDALEGFEGNLAFQLRDKYCNRALTERMQSNASESDASELEFEEDPNRLGLRHLKPILAVVFDVRSKWKFFGLELDLLSPELDAIDARYHGVPEDCLRAILDSWLQRENPKPTFCNILDALRARQVNYGSIAGNIERFSDDKKQKIGFYL